MNSFVSDTMVFILWLEKRKLPKAISSKFQEAENDGCQIHIPSIVFAEIAYLFEKRRIDLSLPETDNYLIGQGFIKEYPITIKTVFAAFEIDDIPELHDRIIAGAAKEKNIAILTNDPAMHNSKHVHAIWS